MKSIKRSKIRIIGGRLFYTLKRQVDWTFSGKKFARQKGDFNQFPVVAVHHETPLIRNLSKVDQWLQLNKIKNLAIAVFYFLLPYLTEILILIMIHNSTGNTSYIV